MSEDIFRPDELVILPGTNDLKLTFRRDDGQERCVVIDNVAIPGFLAGLERRCGRRRSLQVTLDRLAAWFGKRMRRRPALQ